VVQIGPEGFAASAHVMGRPQDRTPNWGYRRWCLSDAVECLKASKLRLDLGGLPDINEPFPPKPKWTRRRTYQRIRNEIQALEAKAKQTRFRKDIDIRTFAYHVG
jgi:hypothetical protein